MEFLKEVANEINNKMQVAFNRSIELNLFGAGKILAKVLSRNHTREVIDLAQNIFINSHQNDSRFIKNKIRQFIKGVEKGKEIYCNKMQ